MSKFKKIDPEHSEGPVAGLLNGIKESMGSVPNVYAVMANSPSVLQATLNFGGTLKTSGFDEKMCEKIALVVSNENSCQYCVSAHSAIAAKMGLSDEEILDAQKGTAKDPREQAILTLAISLNGNHGHGDNSAVAAAFEAGLSATEILDVVGQVVKNIMTNMVNGIAETEIDFPKRALI